MIDNKENRLALIDSESNQTTDIPLKDKFFMSDLERYYQYGKTPYILILQLCLVLATTTLVNTFYNSS